jgi:hypothetical protein
MQVHWVASQYGHLKIVLALLAAKADPNLITSDNGASPIYGIKKMWVSLCTRCYTQVPTLTLSERTTAPALSSWQLS